jgi:DNA-binding GntR family transcriptional regulator
MAPDPNVREHVDRQLRSLIAKGDVLPGESLPVGLLAKGWHVSETPVREAAWRGVGEGWLSVDPRGGFRAWLPDVEGLRDTYDCLGMLLVDAIDLGDVGGFQRIADSAIDANSPDDNQTSRLVMDIGRLTGNAALAGLIEQTAHRLAPFRSAGDILGWDPALEASAIVRSLRTGSRAAVREQVRRFCRRRRMLAPMILGLIEEQRRLRAQTRSN